MFCVSRFLCACVAASFFAVSAFAAPVLIDFETYPGVDGILGTADDVVAGTDFLVPLSTQYTPMGLTFLQGSLMRTSFLDGNPANHFISSTNPIATLSVPVFGLSIASKSYWDAYMTAYNAAGDVIGHAALINTNSGSAFLKGVLSLTTTQAIARFSILPTNSNHILNLDNLVLEVGQVPEPASVALLAFGLLALGVQRRVRRQR